MKPISQTKAELVGDSETSTRSRPMIKPWRTDPRGSQNQYANDAGCGCGPVGDETTTKSS